jgi:hypothetical protein
LILAIPVFIAPVAQAQPGVFPFNPTHYWTYQMEPGAFQPASILVKDQFFPQGIPVTVDSLQRLLNWVWKNNSQVPDTLLHYTWWNVRERVPVGKDVLVTNQFGSHPVRVVNLEFLLVPAYKNFQSPVPPHGDHFLCYRAFGFPAPTSSYDLRDEWRVDFQHPGPLEYLCAPCSKEHGGLLFSVADTVTHLAAYPITPSSGNFAPVLYDQFHQGTQLVSQMPIEYLFVPSEKVGPPTETKRSTWGRLKSLYR